MVQKGSKIASRVSSSGSSASVVTSASRMRRDSLAIACCPSSYRIDMRRGLSADREFLGLVGHQRGPVDLRNADRVADRSEEHTSELQSLIRISYAVFFLK